MRVPNFEQNPSLLQGIGLVICGIVIGGALMTAIAQQNIQEMHNTISQLKNENKSLSEQIANYEKVRNQKNVIAKTRIEWESGGRSLEHSVLTSLEERMADDLKVVIGNPVHADLPTVYRSLIDGKVYYDVNGKNYRIRLQLLSVVGSECIIHVRAEEFIPN